PLLRPRYYADAKARGLIAFRRECTPTPRARFPQLREVVAAGADSFPLLVYARAIVPISFARFQPRSAQSRFPQQLSRALWLLLLYPGKFGGSVPLSARVSR